MKKAIGMAALIAGVYLLQQGKAEKSRVDESKTARIYSLGDINKDGFPDILVNYKGKKEVNFGFPESENFVYLPKEEFVKRVFAEIDARLGTEKQSSIAGVHRNTLNVALENRLKAAEETALNNSPPKDYREVNVIECQ